VFLKNFFLLVATPLLIFLPHFGYAQAVDPRIEFKRIETPHFTVVFDSKHRLIAELYADYAEEAYTSLIKQFNHQAPEKTVIFMDDVSDQANGAAVGIPYSMISAFGVLPGPADPVSDYGNWGRELLMHEFTHILNFEPANGSIAPFRYIFGNLIRPNMFLPRWYLEGLAVEEETEFSNFGRLRSPNFTAQVRALSLDNLLEKENIARINEVAIPYWPGGARPYLMGSLLWDEIIRNKSPEIIGRLNDRYSRRFPFLLSGPINDELNKDYQDLLAEAYLRIHNQSLAQKSKIEASSKFALHDFVKPLGFDTQSPSVSPDQKKLISISHSIDTDSFVELRVRSDLSQSFAEIEPVKILDGKAIQKVSWLPNSVEFIYESIDNYERYYRFSDLYKYNIDSHHRDRLTKGLRAREATVSPDGQLIAFVQMGAGTSRLSMIRPDGSGYQSIYNPEIQFRISRPEFLNSLEIVFSERDTQGHEFLKVIELTNKTLRTILPQFSPAHFSKLTSEGLIFESEKSGVANLYLASHDLKSARPISNVMTGASTADIDPSLKELLMTILTGSGQNLASVQKSVWQSVPKDLAKIEPLVEDHWQKFTPPKVSVEKKIEDYSPWSYLMPRYWFPNVYFLPGGGYFSASTSSADPVGHHAYSLLASYDTLTNKPSGFLSYTNSLLPTPITLNLSDYSEYIYTIGFVRHSTVVNPVLTSFIPSLSNDFKMGLGWNYFQSAYLGDTIVRNGPSVFVSYSNAVKRGLQISPESGGTASLSHTSYLPGLGNIDYEEINFRGSYYLSKFLPKRHVLASFLNLYYAPRLQRNLLGRTTASAVYQQGILDSSFVLRGYPYGALIGKSLYSGNLEYRFPIRDSFEGYNLRPLFFQKYYGAVFLDAATVDGFYYANAANNYYRADAGRYFMGSGLELKADTTLFYQLPVTFTLGLYYGFDAVASYGFTPFIGFLL
jgi:hypothetical protein